MTQQTNPNSTRTLYTFNGMGEETKLEHDDLVSGVWTDMGTFNTTRSADGLVNTIQEPVNGTSSGYKRHLYYNAIGAMQEEDLYNASGSTLSKKQLYSFDKAGNRTERDQCDGSGSFQQGEINAYDAGNERTHFKHYGAGDVLSSTDNFAAGTDFDGNGNELASSGGKAFSMSYHADNLLKQVSGSGFTSETSYYMKLFEHIEETPDLMDPATGVAMAAMALLPELGGLPKPGDWKGIDITLTVNGHEVDVRKVMAWIMRDADTPLGVIRFGAMWPKQFLPRLLSAMGRAAPMPTRRRPVGALYQLACWRLFPRRYQRRFQRRFQSEMDERLPREWQEVRAALRAYTAQATERPVAESRGKTPPASFGLGSPELVLWQQVVLIRADLALLVEEMSKGSDGWSAARERGAAVVGKVTRMVQAIEELPERGHSEPGGSAGTAE